MPGNDFTPVTEFGFEQIKMGKRQSALQVYRSLTQKGKTPDNTSLAFSTNLAPYTGFVFYTRLKVSPFTESLGKYWGESPAIKILTAALIQAIEEHWKLGWFFVLVLKLESSLPEARETHGKALKGQRKIQLRILKCQTTGTLQDTWDP